jgi:hypothetical protein
MVHSTDIIYLFNPTRGTLCIHTEGLLWLDSCCSGVGGRAGGYVSLSLASSSGGSSGGGDPLTHPYFSAPLLTLLSCGLCGSSTSNNSSSSSCVHLCWLLEQGASGVLCVLRGAWSLVSAAAQIIGVPASLCQALEQGAANCWAGAGSGAASVCAAAAGLGRVLEMAPGVVMGWAADGAAGLHYNGSGRSYSAVAVSEVEAEAELMEVGGGGGGGLHAGAAVPATATAALSGPAGASLPPMAAATVIPSKGPSSSSSSRISSSNSSTGRGGGNGTAPAIGKESMYV